MLKLLLAEDEKELNDVLVTILECSHYSVDSVFDGKSLVDHGCQNKYDAMITDVMMPKLDGFEAVRELRARGIETPLLILSAKSEVPDKVKGLELGANDYLSKPFSVEELIARVNAMTRHPLVPPDEISLDHVTLNRSTNLLAYENSSVRLSTKEFRMMEIFIQSPAIAISTERFLDEVWPGEADAQANAVWLYVSYLQKKLAAIGSSLKLNAVRETGTIALAYS